MKVSVAYYEKKDWDYFLSVIHDKDNMPQTWDLWFKEFTKVKMQLIAQGFSIREVTIDINELVDYCNQHNVKNDGKTRSQYVLLKSKKAL